MKKVILVLTLMLLSSSTFALKDSPDPSQWYERANVDLEDAKLILEKTNHYDQVCFLAHQAVEKNLKGALIQRGIYPDHTHYTEQLARRFAKYKPGVKEYLNDLRQLDRVYVPSRYPKPGFIFTKEKAEGLLSKAQVICAMIRSD